MKPQRSDHDELTRRLQPFRRPVLAHCYRMLASVVDAEDAVQEAYLRAWEGFAKLEGGASSPAFRSWLYGIATEVCLAAADQDGRRELPSGLGPPTDDPHAPPKAAGPAVRWVEPIPDALVTLPARDPEAAVTAPRSLRLSYVASLQRLPPRQRAVLALREAVGSSPDEVAALLGMTAAAVKTALGRGRAELDRGRAELDREEPAEGESPQPTRAAARALLDGAIVALEGSDATAISALLAEDVVFEVTPTSTWFSGKATCAPYILSHVLGAPGEWQMVATTANGQPAAIAYRRGDDGEYQAFGLMVLTLRQQGIARITLFTGTDVVRRFEAATEEAEAAPLL